MDAYSLAGYGEMLADTVRREAYAAALAHAVRPETRVLEIGTGPGIFALLAAHLGARQVVALETGEVIALARRLATANHLDTRIRFLRQASTDFQPGQRADLIVSDLRGVLPLERNHLATIADARTRLLAPGGRLIPERDRMWAAVVSAPEPYRRLLDGFEDRFDLDLEIARALLTHAMVRVTLKPEQCLGAPACWATLEYQNQRDEPLTGDLGWRLERGGTAHGVALWFDTELVAGIGFDTGPHAPPTLYRQVLLPFPEPFTVHRGDHVRLRIDAARAGERYQWRWRTTIETPDGVCRCWDQSTFEGTVIDPERLHRRAASFQPLAGTEARYLRWVLARMDGHHTSGEIAAALATAHPARFADADDALAYVADLAQRFG